jgi:hypothetical protein
MDKAQGSIPSTKERKRKEGKEERRKGKTDGGRMKGGREGKRERKEGGGRGGRQAGRERGRKCLSEMAQSSGGRDRRIASLRPAWVTQ